MTDVSWEIAEVGRIINSSTTVNWPFFLGKALEKVNGSNSVCARKMNPRRKSTLMKPSSFIEFCPHEEKKTSLKIFSNDDLATFQRESVLYARFGLFGCVISTIYVSDKVSQYEFARSKHINYPWKTSQINSVDIDRQLIGKGSVLI